MCIQASEQIFSVQSLKSWELSKVSSVQLPEILVAIGVGCNLDFCDFALIIYETKSCYADWLV